MVCTTVVQYASGSCLLRSEHLPTCCDIINYNTYYSNVCVVTFERPSDENILPRFLKFCTRTRDGDHFRSKHVVFEKNNERKYVLDGKFISV